MNRAAGSAVTDPAAALFTMAVAAQLAGLHPQTLRSYERHGLLHPARTDGRTRRYSAADVATAQRIAELSTVGMSMHGVALVLVLEAEIRRLRTELDALTATTPGR